MEDNNNQKEKLKEIINESDEFTDAGLAKRVNLNQLKLVSKSLIQFHDKCNECQEYTDFIIKFAADTNNFRDIENEIKLQTYKNKMKEIVSHMKNKHKLSTEGQYMYIYMCLGTGVGVTLGIAFDNLSIGISMGMCLGLVIGAGIDAYYKKR